MYTPQTRWFVASVERAGAIRMAEARGGDTGFAASSSGPLRGLLRRAEGGLGALCGRRADGFSDRPVRGAARTKPAVAFVCCESG